MGVFYGKVIAILIDEYGKTLGARILSIDNKQYDVQTSYLAMNKETFCFSNAILSSDGYVRAKCGSLPKVIKKQNPNTVELREVYNVSKLLSNGEMILYHGSKDRNMNPMYGKGDKDNDYGSGFYTTTERELGMEWAMSSYSKGDKGYLYTFILNLNGLKVLNLVELSSLHWVAELFCNRSWNEEDREAYKDIIDAFIRKYKLDIKGYDVIVGYKADDSYFTYAEDFVRGAIYRETLEKALRNGRLCIQIFIKSRKAFSQLIRVGIPEVVPDSYKVKYERRRKAANNQYKMDKKNNSSVRKKESIYNFIKEAL